MKLIKKLSEKLSSNDIGNNIWQSWNKGPLLNYLFSYLWGQYRWICNNFWPRTCWKGCGRSRTTSLASQRTNCNTIFSWRPWNPREWLHLETPGKSCRVSSWPYYRLCKLPIFPESRLQSPWSSTTTSSAKPYFSHLNRVVCFKATVWIFLNDSTWCHLEGTQFLQFLQFFFLHIKNGKWEHILH